MTQGASRPSGFFFRGETALLGGSVGSPGKPAGLPCKQQKIGCRDFEGVSGVLLDFPKPVGHLVERDGQFRAKVLFPTWRGPVRKIIFPVGNSGSKIYFPTSLSIPTFLHVSGKKSIRPLPGRYMTGTRLPLRLPWILRLS